MRETGTSSGKWPEIYIEGAYYDDGSEFVVAECGAVRATGGGKRFRKTRAHDEIQADARLLSAAPELLEACKHMLDFCPVGLISSLRAAIAKAEGLPTPDRIADRIRRRRSKMDPLTTEEVTALVKRAHETISDLCQQRKRWVMSIPARPDEDPDLIISAALRAQADTIRDRERERDELQATFDLRWKADMRAIARWRKSNPGNELVLPDQADLCVWLLQEHDEIQRAADEDQEQNDKLMEYARKVAGRRDVHSVYEVLDQVTELQRKLDELERT